MQKLSEKQWTAEHAAHLLSRAGFGATPETLMRYSTYTPEQAVDALVTGFPKYEDFPAPSWVNADSKNRYVYKDHKHLPEEERRMKRQAWNHKQRQAVFELRAWWLYRMRTTPHPLQEKMTLFFHGHFATAQNKVRSAYPHYVQNRLFRRYALGNWKELTREIARDPAMLLYLDNARSNKRKPNENFARELMELFTLGEGNYSEKDILEAARAFTGWSLAPRTFEYEFYPRKHDDDEKTIFGHIGNFDGDDVVDMIFENPAAADHLAFNLIRFFVSDRPDEELQKKLATVIRNENFELNPILTTLFLSEDFYQPKFKNNKIKSPVEWLLGMVIQLEAPMPPPTRSENWLSRLGQKLFHPPNVKGWDGGFSWITASNLLSRYNFSGNLVHLYANPNELQTNLKRMGKMNGEDTPMMNADTMMAGDAMMNQDAPMMAPKKLMKSATELSWPYGAKAGPLVNAEKLIPTKKRNQIQYIETELISRIFPAGLRPKDEDKIHKLLDSLPGPGPWTDKDVKTLLHLMMSTPQYQVS